METTYVTKPGARVGRLLFAGPAVLVAADSGFAVELRAESRANGECDRKEDRFSYARSFRRVPLRLLRRGNCGNVGSDATRQSQ